ncbi:MAG: NnrU family protein [Alphaproteobacteria bacterium]
MLTGTLDTLFAAVAFFVGGHFVLSSLAVRRPIIKAIGENSFRMAYSTLMLVALVWVIMAYRSAPLDVVWFPPVWMHYVLQAVMLPAAILVVAGNTTRSPTAVGGEAILANSPKPATGILTITRHPFLVGVTLWAVGHAAMNGDVASLTLFGGMAILAIGGMIHIDYRRQAQGSDWGPVALVTSRIPFLAALQGRTKIDWRGIGMARLLGGVGLYGVLAVAHEWIAGVSLIG